MLVTEPQPRQADSGPRLKGPGGAAAATVTDSDSVPESDSDSVPESDSESDSESGRLESHGRTRPSGFNHEHRDNFRTPMIRVRLEPEVEALPRRCRN